LRRYPLEILALQRVLDERRDLYIGALREADQGTLSGWLHFFVEAVRDALQQAIQLNIDDSY